MFRRIIIWVIGMLSVQMLSAQMGYRHQIVPSLAPDSLDLAYYGKKRLGQSAATIMGVNVGVWAFSRYVRNQDYAYISLNTIKENFKHGFVWDNDNLSTNMFFHPYENRLLNNHH